MAEITLDLNMDPVERLTKEIEMSTDSIEIRIGEYLLEQFKNDEPLKTAYKDRKVTLEDIYKYVYSRAEDMAKESSNQNAIGLEDKVVFGWVIHFVQDGEDKDIEALRIGNNTVKLTKEDEETARARAMEQFQQQELERLEAERAAKEKKERELAEKREKERLAALEREKKAREESGQMSLFDFDDENEDK